MLSASQNVPSSHQQYQSSPLHPSSNSAPTQSSYTKDNARSRSRLPATIDTSLLPHVHSSRHLFSQALLSDQKQTLQPDYVTPFQSANDVVRRLLPYHVWHVNNTDLKHLLWIDDEKHKMQHNEAYPSSDEAYRLFSQYSRLARRAKRLQCELEGADSSTDAAIFGKETVYNLEKLSAEHERQLLVQEQEKLRRIKENAISAGVSWESLMRLSASFGQVYMHDQGPGSSLSNSNSNASPSSPMGTTLANGNSYRSVATMPMHPTTPRPPPPPAIGQDQLQNDITTSSPATPRPPIIKGSRPRGRPRKSTYTSRFETQTPNPVNHNTTMALSTPRPIQAPPLSNQSNTTPSKPNQRTFVSTTPKKPLLSSTSTTSTTPSTASIPSHPIPLVLPLSTLAQLSALGIAPIPAPHLLPAISAQQAHAQRLAQPQDSISSKASTSSSTVATTSTQTALPLATTVHSTAPRPAPLNQQEPALLMGITEAPLPPARESSAEGKTEATMMMKSNSTTTQQMLHVSIVLSKLTPSQLSGLATLMQGLQANANTSKATTSTSATSTSDGNAR